MIYDDDLNGISEELECVMGLKLDEISMELEKDSQYIDIDRTIKALKKKGNLPAFFDGKETKLDCEDMELLEKINNLEADKKMKHLELTYTTGLRDMLYLLKKIKFI